MAVVGNMIAEAISGNPSTVNFSIFCSVFSMLTLFYTIPASFNIDWAGHPIIMIVLDSLNAVFFFCAAIALAAKLECHSCNNQVCIYAIARDGATADSLPVLPQKQ